MWYISLLWYKSCDIIYREKRSSKRRSLWRSGSYYDIGTPVSTTEIGLSSTNSYASMPDWSCIYCMHNITQFKGQNLLSLLYLLVMRLLISHVWFLASCTFSDSIWNQSCTLKTPENMLKWHVKVLSVCVLLCVHVYMLGDLIIPLEHQFGYGVVYISPLKLEWNCLGGCGPWGP